FTDDFKPASVDTSKSANVEVGEKNQITVTVPHIEGSGTAHTVFKGSQRPYQRECVLVVDNVTGEITLERLSCNIQLKKTRRGSSKCQPRPITPIDSGSGGSRKHSPSQKLSPPQPAQQPPLPQSNGQSGPKLSWVSSSPGHQRGMPRISPSQTQRSPGASQSSPSMPTLVTPREGSGSRAPSASRDSMPLLTTETLGVNDSQEAPDIGVLSDSSESSNSTNKSSVSSDSSDSEHEDVPPQTTSSTSSRPPHSSRGQQSTVNGTNGQQHSNNASFSSMPRFSQLSEDLRLSESGSDSDD
ncbi:unnamed protein product, partial [Ixodes hexagonus]